MRPALLASLLVMGTAVAEARAQDVLWPQGRRGRVQQTAGDAALWSAEARGGWKSTPEDARQDALENARDKVVQFLREQSPPVEWVPPVSYVRRHLVKGKAHEERKDFPDVGVMYQAEAAVRVTGDDLADMVRADRYARMGERELLLVKVLGGLMVVLLLVAGYIRLDEWSKGTYKAWLRLAVAVVAGAGLLLLTCG